MADVVTGLLIGDSHARGAFGQALAALLLQQGCQTGVQAQDSTNVLFWVGQLQGVAPQPLPDVVLVALGSNDWSEDPARWAEDVLNLTAIVEAWNPQAHLVWIAPPVMNPTAAHPEGKADWMRYVLDQVLGPRWLVVDSIPLTRDLPRVSDGMHYGPVAGATWAQRALAALAQAEASRQAKIAGLSWWGWGALGVLVALGAAVALRRR